MVSLDSIYFESKRLVFGPCGEALLILRNAAVEYSEGRLLNSSSFFKDKGKDLEMVFAASLLLYSRSNTYFLPSIFCNPYHCASDLNVKLQGGGEVEYITVDKFPRCTGEDIRAVSTEDIQWVISNLQPNSPGAIIVPSFEFNVNADIIGLFRASDRKDKWDWALLIIQVKNWFFDHAVSSKKDKNEVFILDEWKNNRKVLFPNNEITFTNGNRNETVKIFHILLSSNELDRIEDLQCVDNDGAGSIQTMRAWLPTAAYASESAHNLREIFPSFVDYDDETNSV
jgi:hypothetical protein